MYSGDEIYDDDITSGLDKMAEGAYNAYQKFDDAGVPAICTDWHEEEPCSKLPDRYGEHCDCQCPHCIFIREEK